MQKLHHLVFRILFWKKPSRLIYSFVSQYLEESFEKNLYLPAWKCLKEAQQRGEYVVILSSSPHFLVEAIAQRLGADAWDATYYQVDENDIFSHISYHMQGKDKANYLCALTKRLKINVAAITAYTDSHLDLPFLEAAGKAIAVKPDRILRKICLQKNWEII